ncbi:MAG: YihY family inner membrane protein [Proteobacteria bacterium]|nr:YihY family inner membrane protein [Pseudomonadota bacterium]
MTVRGFMKEISLLDMSTRSGPIFWLLRAVRLFYHLFEECVRDKCLQTAASLAFTTLLALVPISAVSLSVLSRVKFSQESFQRFLFDHLFPSISAQTIIMESIQKLSQNLAAFSVLGLLFLAFVSVSLLNTVEGAFNAIWRVREKRPLLGKFSSFWSVITFSPILLACSIFLSGKFGETTIGGILLRYPYFQILAKYGLPNAMIFAAVFFMYTMLPYTKVRVFPATIGSITATLLFQVARKGFELYIVKVATFDKLYGILGAIPVFLLWIYLSWVVVLLGAEVVYTLQHHRISPTGKSNASDTGSYDGY